VLISRALGGALRLRLAMSLTAVERGSRCVPLPRAASSCLGLSKVGCDFDHPSGEGAFSLCPWGDEFEACST
jgi:hypothetical protein